MTIEWYAYWIIGCGLAVQVWIGWKIGRALGGLLYAAVAAGSFTRFAWACGREHGFRDLRYPRWVYAPKVWFSMFCRLAGAEKGEVQAMGGSGCWKGIGNWTVYPKQEVAE